MSKVNFGCNILKWHWQFRIGSFALILFLHGSCIYPSEHVLLMNEKDNKFVIKINRFVPAASSAENVLKPLVSDILARIFIKFLELE
jgi:hypothetical protein